MADKSSFSADEWQAVLSSPMLAGMAVTLGEPCLSPLKLGHHVSTHEGSERWLVSGIPTRMF